MSFCSILTHLITKIAMSEIILKKKTFISNPRFAKQKGSVQEFRFSSTSLAVMRYSFSWKKFNFFFLGKPSYITQKMAVCCIYIEVFNKNFFFYFQNLKQSLMAWGNSFLLWETRTYLLGQDRVRVTVRP